MCSVSSYPIVIPHFEWTLEWVLPTPVPLHQFEQSPVAIEVTDRNADPDALVYSVRGGREEGRERERAGRQSTGNLGLGGGAVHSSRRSHRPLHFSPFPFSRCAALQGPNVVGGYVHPISGKTVSQADHKALAEASDKLEATHAKPAAAHHHH
jgi:hypothetical protein